MTKTPNGDQFRAGLQGHAPATPAIAGADVLIEQGSAFMEIEGGKMSGNGQDTASVSHDCDTAMPECYDVVVIGAGQAGLSAGYHLARHGVKFVILEAGKRIGDVWRNRWDSLRLFTPARFDGLDGMPFPGRGDEFPTKDELADYLEAYAAKFSLPVRLNTRVDELASKGGHFEICAGETRFIAGQVIVAAASYQKPKIPAFAKDIDPAILQLHSSAYKNPSQLRGGGVLLVGAGNSGAEIAMDVVPRHRVWLSGRDVGHVPFRIGGYLGRKVLVRLVLRGVFHHILTVRTPIGRKARPYMLSHGGPLIRQRPRELKKAGIEQVPRVAGVKGGLPYLDDGRTLEVANIIWCTGFHPGLSWIKLPILGEDGHPRHERGIVTGQPGLYFVGLHFLYSLTSTMIHGVGRDARRIADAVVESMKSKVAA